MKIKFLQSERDIKSNLSNEVLSKSGIEIVLWVFEFCCRFCDIRCCLSNCQQENESPWPFLFPACRGRCNQVKICSAPNQFSLKVFLGETCAPEPKLYFLVGRVLTKLKSIWVQLALQSLSPTGAPEPSPICGGWGGGLPELKFVLVQLVLQSQSPSCAPEPTSSWCSRAQVHFHTLGVCLTESKLIMVHNWCSRAQLPELLPLPLPDSNWASLLWGGLTYVPDRHILTNKSRFRD